MKCFVERMIVEHKELIGRITKLHKYVYSDASDKDNKVEFANKCIQLAAMKKYEEALRARLDNAGIAIDNNGEYFAHLDMSNKDCDKEHCACDSEANNCSDKK